MRKNPKKQLCVLVSLENLKQKTDPRCPLDGCEPMTKRIKSRQIFLHSEEPLNNISPSQRLCLWGSHHSNVEHTLYLPALQNPSLFATVMPGYSGALNHHQTAVGRC